MAALIMRYISRGFLQQLKFLRLCQPVTYHDSQKALFHTVTSQKFHLLYKRGVIQDKFPDESPDIPFLLDGGKQCIYSGFDPTSDSLHIGNLLVIIVLMHLQRLGHVILSVIGDATAQIGDPSGRNTERSALSLLDIHKNSKCIQTDLERLFENHEKYFWNPSKPKKNLSSVRILHNSEWYNNQDLVTFLSTVGRHFRLGQMLSRTSVQNRLNSQEGMSFTEFTYQVFQSFDWLFLYDKYNCRFQVGGSDQMGNIHSGHDLINRVRSREVFGITTPLIKSDTGDKYGKTGGSAIWLNPEKTSPFEFYQFFIRLADRDVEAFLKYFTFLSLQEIESELQKHMKDPGSRHGQKTIAKNVTLLVHGEHGLQSALRATEALFHSTPETLVKLNEEELRQIFQQATVVELLLDPGTTVLDMAMRAKCFVNLEDAERIIMAGGFYINHIRINNPKYVLIPGQHILPNGISVVRVGKKNYYIIKWLM
ncbi:tyrosine--tRNA ligase, mitochondrial-like isoform X1 [Limulus polyphemus]|uniref:Tyrosine--tRNA ligase n=1 Tax=Limulus polyphemus TaxID=6850 RepID=A0ABM1SI65_LIMPO|nr:tyrosine--tRNA ligase, mitochondrial-like isoform X1 [Limulus polyphemus]